MIIAHTNRQSSYGTAPVEPEFITPQGSGWQRYALHNAANILHIQEKLQLTPDMQKKYKIAWVGGCVLYDAAKLREIGGFEFWRDVPEEHAGEDVLAQLRVMKRYGGCGLIPSGAYHQEAATTVTKPELRYPKRAGSVSSRECRTDMLLRSDPQLRQGTFNNTPLKTTRLIEEIEKIARRAGEIVKAHDSQGVAQNLSRARQVTTVPTRSLNSCSKKGF